ncbi:MAG TPA: hypothetical protein VGJ51_17750 [Candidatus Angelobacter sp.]
MAAVDANVLVRLLVADDAAQTRRAPATAKLRDAIIPETGNSRWLDSRSVWLNTASHLVMLSEVRAIPRSRGPQHARFLHAGVVVAGERGRVETSRRFILRHAASGNCNQKAFSIISQQ